MTILEVAIDVPLNTLFDYQCDEATEDDTGRRVLVPFGKQKKVGIILSVKTSSSLPHDKIKSVIEIWRDVPALPQTILKLLKFTSQYYQHPLGPVILHALPPALKKIQPWRSKKNKVKVVTHPFQPQPKLNTEQEQVIEKIQLQSHHFVTWLLKGITGSGKTEVYLKLVEQVLSQGKQALILVPEINLTPLLEERFQSRFMGATITSLHSGIGEKERASRWIEVAHQKVDIVLGTRLAVFAPLNRLGIIIIDEEHDPSYKQSEGMRYHARDLAVVRAQMEEVPVILGSASPSLETWYNAREGRYQLLELNERAYQGARLPQVQLVKIDPKSNAIISSQTLEAIAQRLQLKEQSLIFINRRGYAPVLICNQCQWLATCPHCQTRLVVHRRQQELRCHHCGFQQSIPQNCPSCQSADLHTLGEGTQKIEEFLKDRWPDAKIMRVDSDTLKSKDWPHQLKDIQAGNIDILVGTQILIKGHDFPNLTLVSSINSDTSLYSNDFRASERLFTQLLQAAGRAGRAHQRGEVLIETAFPQHPLFQALIHHNYLEFATNELAQRQLAGFPPYCYQAIFRGSSSDLENLMRFMEKAKRLLSSIANKSLVTHYDVVAPTLPKIGKKFRLQILLQSGSRAHLQQVLTHWSEQLSTLHPSSINWIIDVDPIDC